MSSCSTETITLANSFTTDSTGKYNVKLYTTTTDSSGNSKTSCLPTSGGGFSRSLINQSTGIIDQAQLTAHVRTWLTTNNANAPALDSNSTNPVKTFAQKSTTIRNAIKDEYCYYQNRYAFILKEYLTNAVSSSSTNTQLSEKQKDCVVNLNSLLNQILQIYEELINSRDATIASYNDIQSAINLDSLNSQVDTKRESLQKQSTILQNANLATDAQNAMIDYSIEKNQSSRNLLVIYGFMNLVAASLIIYLYRSTNTQ